MSQLLPVSPDSARSLTISDAVCEKRWYAVSTRSRHEKSVAELLTRKSVHNFLPLYEKLSVWKDRRVKISLPVFPGYLFVRIPIAERLQVLQVPGVATFIGFNAGPCPIPDGQVECLMRCMEEGKSLQPYPFLSPGQRVRVARGIMAGMEGTLLRQKTDVRLVISVEMIMRSVAVEVDERDVVPVDAPDSVWTGFRREPGA